MPEPDTNATAEESRAQATPVRGLKFRPAESIEEVLAAWRLVYAAYRDSGLIPPNDARIHTAEQAIGPETLVVCGMIDELTVSTLSVMVDRPGGVPLDRVYHDELQGLRDAGCTLMEVGLFADRRRQLSRSTEALLELMRFALYFALANDVTDFVIGVHPRHARFYVRSFGFEPIGGTRTYAAVNDNPVTLLRGDLRDRLGQARKPVALDYFVKNPLSGDVFDNRYMFDPKEVDASPIGVLLRQKRNAGRLSRSA